MGHLGTSYRKVKVGFIVFIFFKGIIGKVGSIAPIPAVPNGLSSVLYLALLTSNVNVA